MLWTTHAYTALRPRSVLAMLHTASHRFDGCIIRVRHCNHALCAPIAQQPLLLPQEGLRCLTAHAPRRHHLSQRALQRCNSTAASTPSGRHRLVFLGTPEVRAVLHTPPTTTPKTRTQVAASVLTTLLDAAAAPDAQFEVRAQHVVYVTKWHCRGRAQVAAVVSQPGRPKGRGQRTPTPSPVEEVARARGIDGERLLCPVKANEVHTTHSIPTTSACTHGSMHTW